MLNSLNKIDNILSSVKRLSPLNMKRSNNNYLFAFVANHLIYYPTPISLTYAWSFGFLAGMCLLTQMISGIFLALHYAPHVDLAFSSVEYIMRDLSNELFFRYVYTNGVSMFFLRVYFSISVSLHNGFYLKPQETLWCFCLSVAVFFLVLLLTKPISSIFLIFWSMFQFFLLVFYGLKFCSLARQVVNLYSIMYPTCIVTKHRFKIILLFIVILFISTFQKGSLTCCEWEQWQPYEAQNDNIGLLNLLNFHENSSRKFLIGDQNLALKELNAIDRFLSESTDNNRIKVLETFYLMKDQNESNQGYSLDNYYQVIKTTKIRAQGENVETVRHAFVNQHCHALPAVAENKKLMPHGCVVVPNDVVEVIHKPAHSYQNVPILNDRHSFETLFKDYLNYLLTCRNRGVLENNNLLPEADGQSTLEYGLVFLDSTNMDTLYRLTCWLSPCDSEWNTLVIPESAHLGAPLRNCTGTGLTDYPPLSYFGIFSSSSSTWKNFNEVNFASLLRGYEAEVVIPAFTSF